MLKKYGKGITICVNDCAQTESAVSFASKTGYRIENTPGDELTVIFDREGISLSGYGLTYRGDFESMIRRVSGGRLMHEMLIKAAKSIKGQGRAIDATAGMGEDSFLLAAYGYEVTMYEQNPIIALLLKDSLARARKNKDIADIVSRMHLVEGNSVELLSGQNVDTDLVYLDPMFPKRRKSGLINKKLQLIQKLEPPCSSEEELFAAAIATRASQIIVKRPLKSPYLAMNRPNYTIEGKAIRYDCYVN